MVGQTHQCGSTGSRGKDRRQHPQDQTFHPMATQHREEDDARSLLVPGRIPKAVVSIGISQTHLEGPQMGKLQRNV